MKLYHQAVTETALRSQISGDQASADQQAWVLRLLTWIGFLVGAALDSHVPVAAPDRSAPHYLSPPSLAVSAFWLAPAMQGC